MYKSVTARTRKAQCSNCLKTNYPQKRALEKIF